MKPNQLAEEAVHIANAFKGNTTVEAVKEYILTHVLHLTTQDIIDYFTAYANEHGLKYLDVDDIIAYLINSAEELVSDIESNSFWQNLAQDIYYVANVLKGFVPPKWQNVITVILNTYLMIKGNGN